MDVMFRTKRAVTDGDRKGRSKEHNIIFGYFTESKYVFVTPLSNLLN
jgi:hypothetical protein